MEKYTQLSELLFDLELENISNNIDFIWEFNQWNDSFGENSKKYEPNLIKKESDILKLAHILESDFADGLWEGNEDGLYEYEMPSFYSEYITQCLEKQLASLTGVGYQAEINFQLS